VSVFGLYILIIVKFISYVI